MQISKVLSFNLVKCKYWCAWGIMVQQMLPGALMLLHHKAWFCSITKFASSQKHLSLKCATSSCQLYHPPCLANHTNICFLHIITSADPYAITRFSDKMPNYVKQVLSWFGWSWSSTSGTLSINQFEILSDQTAVQVWIKDGPVLNVNVTQIKKSCGNK